MAPRRAHACALASLLAGSACDSRPPAVVSAAPAVAAASASSAPPAPSAEPAPGPVNRDEPFCAELRPVAPMRDGRMYHRSMRLADGRVLVSSNEQAEIFDPKTEAWAQIADLPKSLFGYVLASMPDGSALLVGSTMAGVGRAFVYEPAGNRWRRAAPPKVGRYGGHTLTPLGDGTVLLVGGAIGPSRPSGGPFLTDVVERYDPKADAWRPAGRLERPRQGHVALPLKDGNVALVGGDISDPGVRHDGGVRHTDSALVYETATGTSRPLEPTGVTKPLEISGVLLEDGRPLLKTTSDLPKTSMRRWLHLGDTPTGPWRALCSLAVDSTPVEPLAVLPGDWLLISRPPHSSRGLGFVSLRAPVGGGASGAGTTGGTSGASGAGGAGGAEDCAMRTLPVPAGFPLASVAATVLADGRVLITGGQEGSPDQRGRGAFGVISSKQAWLLTPCRP